MDTTVMKGFRVLEALAHSEAPLRLADLADRLSLQRSNTHRLLSTLRALGYVDKDVASGRYVATIRTWELGAGVIARHPLRRAARALLEDLHTFTGETVSLLTLDGLEALFLDKLISPRPIKFSSQPGTRFPALLNAAGRVMLAAEADCERRVRESLATYPEAAGLRLEEILTTLMEDRARGYAFGDSMMVTGIVGLAAPVVGRTGQAAGAVMVSGPTVRLSGKMLEDAKEKLLTTCVRIAEIYQNT